MAGYRERVVADLDRWIAAGLVPAENRTAILGSIPARRRLDAAAALGWVGAVLAGLAVIAFIAANWDGLPRLGRFALVLAVFAASAGGAAWLQARDRPRAANAALTFAALAFAAAVGLTGQIFDIAGDPHKALYASGGVALMLGLAGGASGPLAAALVLIGLADLPGLDGGPLRPWLAVAAPVAALLSIRWRSAPLAHAAALGLIAAAALLADRWHAQNAGVLAFSVGLALVGLGGRLIKSRGLAEGGVHYGWLAWGALGFFVAGGYALAGRDLGVPHRIAWLLLGAALVALGRQDRSGAVTGAGVAGLLGASAAVLADLGLDLKTAALVFLGAAAASGAVGYALVRRAPP